MISNIFNSKVAILDSFCAVTPFIIGHRYAKVGFPLKISMSPMRWNDKTSNTNSSERPIHYRIENIQLTTVGENRPYIAVHKRVLTHINHTHTKILKVAMATTC